MRRRMILTAAVAASLVATGGALALSVPAVDATPSTVIALAANAAHLARLLADHSYPPG